MSETEIRMANDQFYEALNATRSLWQGKVSVVAVSGISGSQAGQCQGSPASCHQWPESQAEQVRQDQPSRANSARCFLSFQRLPLLHLLLLLHFPARESH